MTHSDARPRPRGRKPVHADVALRPGGRAHASGWTHLHPGGRSFLPRGNQPLMGHIKAWGWGHIKGENAFLPFPITNSKA
jgi:hypothetical protein